VDVKLGIQNEKKYFTNKEFYPFCRENMNLLFPKVLMKAM